MRALLALLLLTLAGARAEAAQPFDPFSLAKVAPPPAARAPMTGVFRDQRGRTVTLAGLSHGRPMLLVPVQYLCPNLCGLALTGLDQAVQRRADRNFAIAILGIDPRETPAVAARAVARLKTPVEALTGSASASRAVTDALGYRYAWDPRLQQYAHISAVAVLGPDGRLARWLPGPQVDPDALGKTLAQARTGETASIPERLFLLCYHLVVHGGLYDRQATLALRVAGAATVALLLMLIGGLLLRERRRARP